MRSYYTRPLIFSFNSLTSSEFQERFEGFINDREYMQSQNIPTMPLDRKIYKLLGKYFDEHDREMYRTKNLQNGSD